MEDAATTRGQTILPRGTNNIDFLAEDEKKKARELAWGKETRKPAEVLARRPVGLGRDMLNAAIRGPIEGITALPDLVSDALEYGIEATTDTDLPSAPKLTDAVRKIPGYPDAPQSFPAKVLEGTLAGTTSALATGSGLAPAQLIRNTLGAFGASTGIELAKGSGAGPGKQLGAGLVGGVAGTLAPGPVAGIGRGIGTFIPQARRLLLERQVHRMAAMNIPDIEKAFLSAKESERLAEMIPGFSPQLAMSSPQLKPFSDLLRKSDGAISDAQNLAIKKNTEAIINHADRLRSKIPDGSVENAQRAARERMTAFKAADEAKLTSAKEGFESALRPIREEVGDLPDARVFGDDLRRSTDEAYTKRKAAFEPRYAKFDLEIEVDPMRSVQALEALKDKTLKADAQDMPSDFIMGIIKQLGRKKVPLAPGVKEVLGPRGNETLAQMRAVRGRLLQEIRNENSLGSPSETKKKFLSELLDEVSGNIDDAIGKTTSDELKAVNADYRIFKQTFASDAVGEVFRKTKAGTPKKSDTDIFNAFTTIAGGKGVEHFQALATAVGDEQARTIFGKAMMAKMMLAPGVRKADGTFAPAAIQTFISKHEQVLNKLPSLQRQIQTLKRTATEAIDAPLRPPTLRDQDLAVVKLLVGGSPEEAIKKIVSSGNIEKGMGELAQLFGSSDAAFRALARPMWDELFDQAGLVRGSRTTATELNSKELGKLLQKHEPALRKLYGEEAYENLVGLQNAFELNAGLTQYITATPDIPKGALLRTINTAASRAFGIARGVIGAPFTTTEVFAKRVAKLVDAFDDRETRLLMDNMMHDKNLLTTLSKIKSARDLIRVERDMKKWLRLNAPPVAGASAQRTFDTRNTTQNKPQLALRQPTVTELALGGTHPYRP